MRDTYQTVSFDVTQKSLYKMSLKEFTELRIQCDTAIQLK